MRSSSLVSVACAAAALALAGCGTGGYSTDGNQTTGKQLFVDAKCGACHTLADAPGAIGTIGPNLDDAFAQAREDGMTEATFVNIVRNQILFPIEETSTGAPGMPGPDTTLPECDDVEEGAFCVEDQRQAVKDIAVYVGSVVGTDTAPEQIVVTDGRSIFIRSCAQCHVLADAGTTGTIGPRLDQSRPSRGLALERVMNGRGAMPSFRGSLSPAQIAAVAEYVASVAGRS